MIKKVLHCLGNQIFCMTEFEAYQSFRHLCKNGSVMKVCYNKSVREGCCLAKIAIRLGLEFVFQ